MGIAYLGIVLHDLVLLMVLGVFPKHLVEHFGINGDHKLAEVLMEFLDFPANHPVCGCSLDVDHCEPFVGDVDEVA